MTWVAGTLRGAALPRAARVLHAAPPWPRAGVLHVRAFADGTPTFSGWVPPTGAIGESPFFVSRHIFGFWPTLEAPLMAALLRVLPPPPPPLPPPPPPPRRCTALPPETCPSTPTFVRGDRGS